jgi:hypothetical protein
MVVVLLCDEEPIDLEVKPERGRGMSRHASRLGWRFDRLSGGSKSLPHESASSEVTPRTVICFIFVG